MSIPEERPADSHCAIRGSLSDKNVCIYWSIDFRTAWRNVSDIRNSDCGISRILHVYCDTNVGFHVY